MKQTQARTAGVQECLLFERHTIAHVPCRGFLTLRPARELRAARYARRLTESERHRPAQGENAMRNSLTDMEVGRGKTLTK